VFHLTISSHYKRLLFHVKQRTSKTTAIGKHLMFHVKQLLASSVTTHFYICKLRSITFNVAVNNWVDNLCIKVE